MTDAALRTLAELALTDPEGGIPGAWHWTGDNLDTPYLNAVSPTAILELLDRLEKAEAAIESVRATAFRYVDNRDRGDWGRGKEWAGEGILDALEDAGYAETT